MAQGNKNPNMSGLKMIKKGQVLNPNGRSTLKTSKELINSMFSELVTVKNERGETKSMTTKEVCIMAQINRAKRGDVRAFESLLDRTDGKPVQTQVIISDFESKFSSLSVQELIELREIAKKEAEAVGVVYVPVIELKE